MVKPPDPRLTRDCLRPVIGGNTYRDLATLTIEQDAAIQECTERMRVLRK